MSDDLEQLAARGREAREARGQKKQRGKPAGNAGIGKLARNSLRTGRMGIWLVIITAVVMAPAAVVMFTTGDAILLILTMVAGIVAALAATRWLIQRSAKLELAWLRGLPYGVDEGRYLEVLDREYHRKAMVTVRIGFAEPVPGDAQRTVADAVVGACDASSAQFDRDGDTLIARSKPLQTQFTRRSSEGGTNSYVSNRLLHQWFRALVDQAVGAAHGSYRVTSITVSAENAD
jgi:hypothetical protein